MGERVYCTYIVANRSHTLYIGVSGSLLKRVFEHKQRKHEGFFAMYNCNRLVWFERHMSPEGAIAREKQLEGAASKEEDCFDREEQSYKIDLSEGWYAVDPTIDKEGLPLCPR
jgi:putative endonuclease